MKFDSKYQVYFKNELTCQQFLIRTDSKCESTSYHSINT